MLRKVHAYKNDLQVRKPKALSSYSELTTTFTFQLKYQMFLYYVCFYIMYNWDNKEQIAATEAHHSIGAQYYRNTNIAFLALIMHKFCSI